MSNNHQCLTVAFSPPPFTPPPFTENFPQSTEENQCATGFYIEQRCVCVYTLHIQQVGASKRRGYRMAHGPIREMLYRNTFL